jgi:hypothetical protein
MGIVHNYGGLLATRLCLGIAGMDDPKETILTVY